MNVILFVPTVLLVLIVRNHRLWITSKEIKEILTRRFWGHVFYATTLSFIGFNILGSLTSVNGNAQETIVNVPIIYVYSILVSPIVEELICRKYLFSWLDKKFGFVIAAFLSSTMFAIPHFNVYLVLGYIWLGLVWSWHYKKSGNILVSIVSHLIYNYIAILLMSLGG